MRTSGTTSKTAKAYRHLRQFIDEGRFNGDERLTEKELARRLGMSRGPIRESLVRLQSEGLLQAKGIRRGRIVLQITDDQNPDELISRYEVREQIEGGAARLAAKNMNGWQIDHLSELAQRVKEAADSGDAEQRYNAVAEFHQYLISNCGNALIQRIWEADRLMPPRPSTLELEKKIMENMPADGRDYSWLEEVVQAIAARDQDRAETLMKTRIRSITEALRKTFWSRGPK